MATKRHPNFTEKEKMAILLFVQEHRTQLLGKAGRPGHGDDKVEERKAKYWQKCAAALKAAGGKERHWKKIRKQWSSLKDKAKKAKNEMRQTGGGPKPHVAQSTHFCMEVMARESLEGIHGRSTEVDPLGNDSVEMSQESSQETVEEAGPSTSVLTATSVPTATTPLSVVALEEKVQRLEAAVETLSSQPSGNQRAVEIRQLKFQEEFLKLERSKLDIMRQTLEVQKKICIAMESMGARSLLVPMTEQ